MIEGACVNDNRTGILVYSDQKHFRVILITLSYPRLMNSHKFKSN